MRVKDKILALGNKSFLNDHTKTGKKVRVVFLLSILLRQS